jgi:hypothetical protein
MNRLFAREVYIRLTDEETALVHTVKYGKFYAKATELALDGELTPGVLDEKALMLARKRFSGFATPEEQ